MNAAELINVLISGNANAILAAAPTAASLIEEQEERIAIMGEMLTDKEYNEVAEAARIAASSRRGTREGVRT